MPTHLPLHIHAPAAAHLHPLTYARATPPQRTFPRLSPVEPPLSSIELPPFLPAFPFFSTKLRPTLSASSPTNLRTSHPTAAHLLPTFSGRTATSFYRATPIPPCFSFFYQRNCAPLSAHLCPCLCVPLLHTLAFEGRSEPIRVYQSLSEPIRFPPISSE